MPILIDTGPSERGWHRLEAWARCPRLYHLGYGRSGESPEIRAENESRFPPAMPLVRGSIGHVGAAHLYARLREQQTGGDPEKFYPPGEAMQIVAGKYELGPELLGPVTRVLKSYIGHLGGRPPWRILGVEEPLETTFGPYRYTARADLVFEDRAGKVWILDHKFVSTIKTQSVRRYETSGQFLGLTHLGWPSYGEKFGGVQVNLLGMDGKFYRDRVDCAPAMLEAFPQTVIAIEEEIAEYEHRLKLGGSARYSPSEFTCQTAYGICPAIEICRFA